MSAGTFRKLFAVAAVVAVLQVAVPALGLIDSADAVLSGVAPVVQAEECEDSSCG